MQCNATEWYVCMCVCVCIGIGIGIVFYDGYVTSRGAGKCHLEC